MATPDVSVHMEEVVVVTTPDNVVDGSSGEEVKTVLVTTSLSQHSSDLNQDTLETENAAAAAAAAFTASAHLKEALLVKMAEGDDCVEAEIVYPITCGDSKANLIWRKFVCPGINVKCVQYDNHLISPKEFVHLAGKSTLKDWKRAIRMNGIMLRKIMDSGDLDFYEHTKVCSNTCRSTKIDLTGARVSLTSQTSTEYIPLTPASADVNGSPATITIETCEDSTDWTTSIGGDTCLEDAMEGPSGATQDSVDEEIDCSVTGNLDMIVDNARDAGEEGQSGLQKRSDSGQFVPAVGDYAVADIPNGEVTASDHTFSFWRSLNEAGLLEDVIQEFHLEFMETMKGLQQRVLEPPLQLSDAVLLNNTVQNFGMLDLVKKVLASHKCQMDRSREQYTRDLAALEQQCDEHRKRAKELKHKSQHLNNVLMTLTPVSIPSPLKRPRLTRATSGPPAITSRVLTQSAQILASGLPVTQLANLPIGKMVSAIPASTLGKSAAQVASASSPASPLLGGYTVLASAGSAFPNAVEIHPDASNLTVLSTAAIQDGSTVVKVVSPFQLLTLPGLGTAIQNVTQMTPSGSTIVTVPSSIVEGTAATEEHTTIEVTTVADEAEQK